MRVLLPAPFSPISPRTSPALTARSTPSRACVAPKRFRTPDMLKSGEELLGVVGGESIKSGGYFWTRSRVERADGYFDPSGGA